MRRSGNKSNDPAPVVPKRGGATPLIDLSISRDPEGQQDKHDRPSVFWHNWPWSYRFYATPSFHHLFYAALTACCFKIYLTNSWYRTPLELYIMHDGKKVFPLTDNIFTFSSFIIISIIGMHLAISIVPFVFNYYQMIHVREVNMVRTTTCGIVDALCVFVCNAHFGLHDIGSLLGCAIAAFSVSLFVLLGEHFSYYNALFVSGHMRALPAIELYSATIFSIALLFGAWLGPLLRALGAYQEQTVETNPVRILEIFISVALRVLIDSMGAANLLTYNIVERSTWLLLVLQVASFAAL
jgi:hypothetical protein